MPNTDLYQVLQVIPEAEPEVIQAAYRALVKKYHPDTGRSNASNERMKTLNEAYAVLADALRRQDYNMRRQENFVRRSQRAASATPDEEVVLRPGSQVEIRMVRVPGGMFTMGRHYRNTPIGASDSPQHGLSLPEYLIGKYPITVGEFAGFVCATGYVTTAEQEGDATVWSEDGWVQVSGVDWRHPYGPDGPQRPPSDHPVTSVSWEDAQVFCRWASQQTGILVRLPTEPEWEKAARGADGRPWPWGHTPPDNARTNLSRQGTLPVGNYSPQGNSPCGCADMLGSVWQWTLSAHQPYPYVPGDGREDLQDGFGKRVLRGGPLWLSSGDHWLTQREPRYPVFRSPLVGFRIVAEHG